MRYNDLPATTRSSFTERQIAQALVENPVGREFATADPLTRTNQMRASIYGLTRAFRHGAYSPETLRTVGGNPDAEHLLELERNGINVIPAFQFERGGAIKPLVLEINALHRAAQTPWGTNDWWFGDHTALINREVLTSRGLLEAPVSLLDLDAQMRFEGLSPEDYLRLLIQRVLQND